MIRILTMTAVMATLWGCDDHTEGTVAAEVTEVAETPAAPAAETPAAPTAETPAAPGLTANGENSTIQWVGAKITASHPGGFNEFTVEANTEGTTMTAIQGTIQVGSLFSDSDRLTQHLLDADFFEVATFGTVTFTSSKIEAASEGGHTVTGVLEMHGVKKEISFPAQIAVAEDGTASFDAEFNINRNDWGISYPGRADDAIKELVVVKLDFNLS